MSTGKVYCVSCGAGLDGKGAVTDLSVLDTEPVTGAEREAPPYPNG